MKTIFVVYSNEKVNVNNTGLKRYAFNTESEVEVGDCIVSRSYDTMMVIVKVLDEKFNYYNTATGELTKECRNTKAYEIKKLEIVEEFSDVVYATKVDND